MKLSKNCRWHAPLWWLTCLTLAASPWTAVGQTTTPSPTAEQLLNAAVMRLSRQPSVSANVRQRIDLYGRRLIGSGSYRQLRTRTDLLFRFELKVPVGDTLASLLQVSDGRYLWTYRVLPDKQIEKGLDASLSTVDLNRVRELLFDPHRPLTDFSMGGLPGLLEHTARMFQFQEARQSGLQGMPVWVLSGEIRPLIASQLSLTSNAEGEGEGEEGRETSSEALMHIPDRVRLALGSEDLFPYQIEFRKTDRSEEGPASRLLGNVNSHPIMTLEMFEVQTNAAVDPELFAFRPPNFPIDDSTNEFLENERLLGRTDAKEINSGTTPP